MLEDKWLLIKRLIFIMVGSFIYAFGVNALLLPHGLLSGGVTGIAMLLQYLLKIPLWITVVLLNIPLFIAGYSFVGKRFTYLSIFGIACVSLFLFLTGDLVVEIESIMIAAIFGGLISGAGTGIVIKNRGSLGGTDILSVILNKYFSLSIGGTAMVFNALVLIVAAFFFEVEIALYTIVGIFVGNKAIDAILQGFNHKKTIIVVTDKHREIAHELFSNIRRGITFLEGEGAYTGKEKHLIYMVVRTMELARIRDIVRKMDPDAFMSIIEDGDEVSVDVNTGVIENITSGRTYQAAPFPEFMQEIIKADGLINYVREREKGRK
jgi:uncharacterized membrane-anchored protein YitT (DUF2179 family)